MAGWPAAVAVVWLTLVSRSSGAPRPQQAPAGAGQRINDTCSTTADCALVDNSVCNTTLGTCQCARSHPIPNVISCLPAASINDNCTIHAQCRPDTTHAECVRGVCMCDAKYYVHTYADGVPSCLSSRAESQKTPVDPVMIGILASLVLMFVIICVVLRLFSKAQFHQNRTILNSANPRLMNASFLKGPLIKSSPVDQLRRASRSASVTSLRRDEERRDGDEDDRRTSLAVGADVNQVEVEVTRHGC